MPFFSSSSILLAEKVATCTVMQLWTRPEVLGMLLMFCGLSSDAIVNSLLIFLAYYVHRFVILLCKTLQPFSSFLYPLFQRFAFYNKGNDFSANMHNLRTFLEAGSWQVKLHIKNFNFRAGCRQNKPLN